MYTACEIIGYRERKLDLIFRELFVGVNDCDIGALGVLERTSTEPGRTDMVFSRGDVSGDVDLTIGIDRCAFSGRLMARANNIS